MASKILLAALPLLIPTALHAHASASPVSAESLRRHIEVLASDAFEGRLPGTEGENKTLAYMVGQFRAAGLEPAGEKGGWYQIVPLVERRPAGQQAAWKAKGRALSVGADAVVLTGAEPSESIREAPVWFAGQGLPSQIAGRRFDGAVVLLLADASGDAPDYVDRALALAEAGAVAVIAVMGEHVPWSSVKTAHAQPVTRLGTARRARITGAIQPAAAKQLGASLADGAKADFVPVGLGVTASLDATTQVRRYTSRNVIGRLKGSGGGGEAILYLGHWDHLGLCRPEGSADRICNGAVDNASGLAMLIETAKALSSGPRPARDVLFMGTTAEEMGLLGAEYFAQNPTVPLASLVAAINIDTVAVAPAGKPVAIIGRGTTPLDPLVDETTRELGREVDSDVEANAFVERQDGWALTRAGIPTVMVGGSFADLKVLNAFLSGAYHQPEDDLVRNVELGGAAEDTALMIALGRKLADPARYRPSQR